MQLSHEAIQSFITLYEKKYSFTLSESEANSKGLDLLELIQVLCRNIPQENAAFLKSLDN